VIEHRISLLRLPSDPSAGGKITSDMVEEAKRDPTVQEIVVALRETTFRGKGRGMTVVGRRPEESSRAATRAWTTHADDDGRESFEHRDSALPDVAELRDAEMQRLLSENARLNERVVFLLKTLEREQAARRERGDAGEHSARADREAIAQEVRGAIEVQLKPVLMTVLQLLQQPASGAAQRGLGRTAGGQVSVPIESRAAPPPDYRLLDRPSAAPREESGGYHSGWILDLISAVGGTPSTPKPIASDADRTDDAPSYRGRNVIAQIFRRIVIRPRRLY
jgi:hypothetical protein